MIEVLLVSPRLSADDPRRCGDHTYTDLLLQNPPEGVEYYHYEDLIAAGYARRIRPLQAMSHYLTRAGILPPDMWYEAISCDFVPDVIHLYGFSVTVRVAGVNCKYPPIVLGVGTGGYSDLQYYHGWNRQKIERARRLKRLYLKTVCAHDSSLRPEQAARILTWSAFSRHIHLDEGYVPEDRISVLYPGLPSPQLTSNRRNNGSGTTYLFIGRNFERKNGSLVLQAFRSVHCAYPQTRLLLISEPVDGRSIEEPGVSHHRFVPRELLLSDFLPQADVFLLPSKAEGFGLAALEAMSFGIPVIAVNAWAMPEIVQDEVNGFLIDLDSLDQLTSRMMQFAQTPTLTKTMQEGCQAVFQRKFSIEVHNTQLLSHYVHALAPRREVV